MLPFLIALLQLPSFGSAAAGTMLLAKDSPIRPAEILTQAGALEGFWVGGRATTLTIVRDPPAEELVLSAPGYYGFKEDFFRIELPASPVHPRSFNSAYGTFAAFAVDVDGDQRDELVLETGSGRGTSVYRRVLNILKPVQGEFRALLADLPLNGYYFGSGPTESEATASGSWSRTYSLERRDGRVSVVVNFAGPEHAPEGLGPLSAVEAFQFQRLRYVYDAEKRTYALTDYEYRRLP